MPDDEEIIHENVKAAIQQINEYGQCTLIRGDLAWLEQILEIVSE
jgi:hypothetical protein